MKDRMDAIFIKNPDILYNFADISYSNFSDKYKCALVFAVPYGKQLTLDTYNEELFEQGILEARERLDEVLVELEKLFQKESISYYIPPVAQTDEKELKAPFSFKYSAVNAGLGWIGKNDVLITKEYGPRIRLSAILIDYNVSCGTPITESLCPDACNRCVDICPYHALSGKQWNISMERSELIDFHKCNKKRSLLIEKLGRKNSCGLCMVICPYGKLK